MLNSQAVKAKIQELKEYQDSLLRNGNYTDSGLTILMAKIEVFETLLEML